MTTLYGQSDAVAVELAAALNAASAVGAFHMPLVAERLFARKVDVGDIPKIDEPVVVEVIPGDEMADLAGLDQVYDDTYGCHIILLQNVANRASGGMAEEQIASLLRLRSAIVEYIASRALACPNANHPFTGARVKAVRNGKEGVYDLARLESTNVFYSEIILTYKAVGLRRRNG